MLCAAETQPGTTTQSRQCRSQHGWRRRPGNDRLKLEASGCGLPGLLPLHARPSDSTVMGDAGHPPGV